ncbi:hypothetical protein JCM33374_g3425 [Metschnikowia sp. JCM 33374]|nr:hypothetical protein JCM33374_g3425 [Metschnikowia sp. JCM 33374]
MSRKVLGTGTSSTEESPFKQTETNGHNPSYYDGKARFMETWLDQTVHPLERNENVSKNQSVQDRVCEQKNQDCTEPPNQSQVCEFCKIDTSGASGCADCPICYYYWTGIKGDGASKLRSTLVPGNNFWWKRPKGSGARSFASTKDSIRLSKGAFKYGFCQLLSRKLHVDSVTRKVIGWSRKVRVAAKSSTYAGKSLAVHGNSYYSEWEQEYSPEFYCEAVANLDFGGEAGRVGNDTDDTEDIDSIETLEDVGEIQKVRVCDGENETRQDIDGSPPGRGAASGATQIPPFKPFSSVIIPISQLSDISSESEFEFSSEDTREIRGLSGHGQDVSNNIGASRTENTPISGTSQVYRNLEATSSSSTSVAQKIISSVSQTFMTSCEASLKYAETTFLGERGLLQFLTGTKEEGQRSQPISNSRQGNSGLDIEGETLPSEGLNPPKKNLTLVGKRFSGVDAEGLDNAPERNYAEENMGGPVLEKPLTRLEHSSPELTGFALGGIEAKTETDKDATIDIDVSYSHSKDDEAMEGNDYLVLDVSSRPIDEKDTLWYLLDLTGQEDWQRIRSDFLKGEDLHIILDAKSSLSFLPTMRSAVLEKANLGGNNEYVNYCQRAKKISFSQQLEVTSTQKTPSKSILKKGKVTSDVGYLKVFEQAFTAEERQTMEKERTSEHFTSLISFILINYVRVVKHQLLDYNHYLSEIRTNLDTALGLLKSAGEQFCILVDFMGTTPKSPQSLLEVQEKTALLMSSLSSSNTVLQIAQNSLKQLASKGFDYVNTMVDLFKKTMRSQRDICDTYKIFLRFFIHDTAEINEADIITGFGDFEKEVGSLNNPLSGHGISKIDKILISLQTSCDIINRSREDLEARTKQIITSVSKLKFSGFNQTYD